jgi:hypothetical protein
MAGVSYSVDSDFYVGVRMGQPDACCYSFCDGLVRTIERENA